MLACIISTAQQASPNVIHMSEPVRAQAIRSSAAASTYPLFANSAARAPSKGSLGAFGCSSVSCAATTVIPPVTILREKRLAGAARSLYILDTTKEFVRRGTALEPIELA